MIHNPVIRRTTHSAPRHGQVADLAGGAVGAVLLPRPRPLLRTTPLRRRGAFAETVAFDLGKSRDTYGPIGPVVVSPDSFADPDNLRLICDVNGERRQEDRTSRLIFDIPTLVSYLSSILTLSPGDLIFTGTPEGVGAVSRRFLREGDVITTTIEGIGTMTNRCRLPERAGQ